MTWFFSLYHHSSLNCLLRGNFHFLSWTSNIISLSSRLVISQFTFHDVTEHVWLKKKYFFSLFFISLEEMTWNKYHQNKKEGKKVENNFYFSSFFQYLQVKASIYIFMRVSAAAATQKKWRRQRKEENFHFLYLSRG